MARVDVIMPQMGESIAEGTLSRWLKKVGDEVKRDEPIFEISTDKVDAEIPAPTAGVLAEILVTEGQTVAGADGRGAHRDREGRQSRPVAPAAGGAVAAAAAVASGAGTASATLRPRRSRRRGRPCALRARVQRAAPANGDSFEDRLRTKRSPLVRKIAAEHGIEIARIAGQWHRRPRHEARHRRAHRVWRDAPPRPRRRRPSLRAPAGARSGTAPPSSRGPATSSSRCRIRALTAEHMNLSRRTTPTSRRSSRSTSRASRASAPKKRAEFEEQTGEKLTYLPFIIKAVTDGLKQFPILNAVGERHQHHLPQADTTSASPSRSTGGSSSRSSSTPTICRWPASRGSSTTSRPARARRSCSRTKCRTRRSRSRTPASSARSWARRSSRSPRPRSSASARSRSGRRSSPGPTARTRSRSARARTSRSRSITASSTARTPTSSWRS